MAKYEKYVPGILVGAVIVVALIAFGMIDNPLSKDTTPATGNNQETEGNKAGNICYGDTPSANYSSVDKYAKSTIFYQTPYIKANGRAPVTSLTAPVYGDQLTYWASNSTYWCTPITATAKCGKTDMQIECVKNATTVTVRVQDLDSSGTPDLGEGGSGTDNVTLGANGAANLKLLFKGTSKQSMMALGGCVAIETPTTISSVELSGAISSLKPCPYIWTKAPETSGNVVRKYEVPAGFDDAAVAQTISSDFTLKSGATDVAFGDHLDIVFQSANYYVGDDGNFYLGIEKDKNQDTTLVGTDKASQYHFE